MFLRNLTNKSTETYSDKLNRLKATLNEADLARYYLHNFCRLLCRIPLRLFPVQFAVITVFLQQFPMRSLLHQPPLV